MAVTVVPDTAEGDLPGLQHSSYSDTLHAIGPAGFGASFDPPDNVGQSLLLQVEGKGGHGFTGSQDRSQQKCDTSSLHGFSSACTDPLVYP